MAKSKPESSRGVLKREEGAKHFRLARYHPDDELSFFIEHYWIVQWDLRGKKPFCQDVLSHPSVQLVFEKENTWVWGVVTGKFTRELKGEGKVLGIKFRPGGFYPFFKKSVAELTDDVFSVNRVFDELPEDLESRILDPDDDKIMVKKAEAFLRKYLPEKDPKTTEVCEIVECIMNECSILRVDDVVARFGLSKRSLQRLIKRYVGVNPKWIIQRYRLHEAAEKMADEETKSWSALALDLGYFDQSHFIRDFKSIVGESPVEYMQNIHSKN